MFDFGNAVCPAGFFFLHPHSVPLSKIVWTLSPCLCTAFPASNPQYHWNAVLTDLYLEPHPCSGSPFALFYFTEQALNQDEGFVCALPAPNANLVYLWLWQSFFTLRMLVGMITTLVCAWGTMQCGQGQLQMIVPVNDINCGNVKRPSDK